MTTLSNFWDEFKKINQAKFNGIKPANLVRKYEELQNIANQLSDEDKASHPYISKIINGETVTNNYGKKLYFKLGE